MATATLSARNSKVFTERVSIGDSTLKVDRVKGVIFGVKVLGLESRNGRSYSREAVAEARPMYEGARINVNHPEKNPGAARNYQDRLGHLENVRVAEDGGLRADLRFNPKHALAEQLAWDAENAPQNVGLSHNIEGKTRYERGKTIVESITKVQSVDVVADPATTNGLFEGEGMDGMMQPEAAPSSDPIKDALFAKLAEIFDSGAEDRGQQMVTTIKAMLKVADQLDAAMSKSNNKPDAGGSDSGDSADGATEAMKDELNKLREQVDRLTAEKNAAELEQAIAAELTEAKLPAVIVTDFFRGQLRVAKDAAARKALIEDRRAIAGNARGTTPTSKDSSRTLTETTISASDFEKLYG